MADSFTVVIIDDDPDGEQVLQLAENWQAAGLLGGFAVVTPGSIQSNGFGPSKVMAHLIGTPGLVDLMTHLGSQKRDLIRLMVLHLLTHEDSSAERMVTACNEVAALVGRAMPIAITTDGVDRRMRLLRINLMVPESDLAPQRMDIVQPGWEVNAVVSPEDRPDLDRMSVFVRASENLHGHGLAAAATIGGLWRGMESGAFDSLELDSTTGGSDVLVVRSQAKMVLGDDRADQLAHAAVRTVAGKPDGAVQAINWGFISDRGPSLVEATLARLLEEPEWAPSIRQHEPLSQRRLSIGQLLKDWLRFQARLPFAAMGFLGGHAVAAVERGVTSAVIGSNAGVIAQIIPMTPAEAAESAAHRLSDLATTLEPRRLEEDAASWGQTTPTAWRVLREVSIGLVDGSDLPSQFVRHHRAGLDEALPPSFIVPPENDPLVVAGSAEMRSVDVKGFATVAAEIAARKAAAQAALAEALAAEAAAAAERASQLPPGTAIQKTPKSAKTTALEASVDAATKELQAAEAWAERRRHVLMWALARRVYESWRSEGIKARAATEAVVENSVPPDTRELQIARNWLIASWIVGTVSLVVVGLLTWLQTRIGWTREGVEYTSAAGMVTVLIFVLGGHKYYRALRRYEWTVRTRLHALQGASDEYVSSRQQEKRWALMYAGVLDWGDILGQLLHHPWLLPEATPPVTATSDPGLPAAVAVAAPIDESVELAPDVTAGVLEAICHRGWLTQEFHRVVKHSTQNDPENNPSSGDLAADLDLGLRPNGPRADLLATTLKNEARQEATEAVFAEIDQLVVDGKVRAPQLTVVRLGQYSGGVEQSDIAFLAGSNTIQAPFAPDLFGDKARVQGLGRPERTTFSLPVGMSPPIVENSRVTKSRGSLATRVDISQPLEPRNLTMFEAKAKAPLFDPDSGTDDFN